MGLSDLVNRARDIVQKRGGTEALKADAEELKDIAKSDASTSEKLKKGAEALKEPGAQGGRQEGAGAQKDPGAEGTRPEGAGAQKDPGERRPRQ
jgi:hypothetical protein